MQCYLPRYLHHYRVWVHSIHWVVSVETLFSELKTEIESQGVAPRAERKENGVRVDNVHGVLLERYTCNQNLINSTT